MSFGFSIGDLSLCVTALWEVVSLLHGGAVAEFTRYKNMYGQLKTLAEFIRESARGGDEEVRVLVNKELRAIHKLLKSFFSRIEDLSPYLGHRRFRGSFWSTMAKICWPLHAKSLEKLHRELQDHVNVISTIKIHRPELVHDPSCMALCIGH